MNKFITILAIVSSLPLMIHAQKIGVKTNLLYGGYTYTPNLGIELALSEKTTLDLGVGYNPWNLDKKGERKNVHWLAEAEFRYWLCQRFNGHFLGAHLLGTQYNINNQKLPLLFGENSEDHRYEGFAVGGGLSYGYHWILGNRWNLEATLGLGYARMNYDKFRCTTCGEKIGNEHRNYWGPTKAGISIIYLIK